MNTKQLKAKVLELAIHGKLLSLETVAELKKSPDYETADILLEKIRKEKEEKIAKGELKRDKKDSYIFVGDDKRHYEKFADGTVKDIEDEIPFDVPEGWAWCRLGDLCLFQNGYAFLSSKFSKDGKTKVIRISDITDGFVDESNCVFSLEEVEDDSFLVKKGDLLIAMSGATTGKNGIYNSDNTAYINQRVGNIKVRTPDALLPDFRNYYIQAMETEILKQAYGGAQPNISSTKILEMFFPLPPLIEQKEIVSKLEIDFEQIISIDANKNDLQIAIKKTKSKILDLAIHGKLVPQDTNDESASTLLEKLRAEKEEKIAKGELKRDKNDSFIYKGSDNCYYQRFADGHEEDISEEIPCELPESWAWCRIKDICTINPKNKLDDNLEVSFIPMTLIDAGYTNHHGQETRVWKKIKTGFTHFAENDVAIAKISPCFENKKSVILKNLKNGYGAGTTELYILRACSIVLPEYLFWIVKTDSFIKEDCNIKLKQDI